ncbi:MAG: hypothetical protein U0Q16_36055 [Bryobacteraceae bacterium]
MIHWNLIALTALTALPAPAAVSEIRLDIYQAPGRADAVEYDVVVPAGVDPARVSMRFDGAVDLDARGDLLVMRRDGSTLRHSAPVSYQIRGTSRVFVPSRFRLLRDGAVGFEVTGHDPALPLVIDPVVTASRYFDLRILEYAVDRNTGNAYAGILGSSSLLKISPLGTILATTVPIAGPAFPFHAMTVDNAGSLYVAAAMDCPAGTPAIGSVPGGDIFVGKLNPDNTTFAYTLCVRPGPFRTVAAIATDGAGALYVEGTTLSDTFPATGNFGTLISGQSHLYVFKVNPAGTNLVYSIVTGNEIQSPYIAVDNNGNAFAAGMTGPVFEPRQAFKPVFEGGAFDAFLLRILPDGSNIPFATFLGGTNATGVTVVGAGEPVVGVANATLPVVGPFSLPNSAAPSFAFPTDVYLGKFSADGQQLLLGTYVPGTAKSGTIGTVASRGTDIYISGKAVGAVPPVNELTPPPDSANAFAVKLDSQFRRVLSTRFGGSEGEEAAEVAVSKAGFVLFGRTQSADLPAKVNSFSGQTLGAENGYIGFVSEKADMGISVVRKSNIHRVTITNFGQENATEIRLSGSFANNPVTATDFPCSTLNFGASTALTCQVGTLFKNETKSILVTTANAVDGHFSISSALADPNGGNDQAP